MIVYHQSDPLPVFKNAVITLGSFDGAHLGHKRLIDRMVSLATDTAGETVAITFEPHPREVIYPQDKSLRLLSTMEEKIELLRDSGLDYLVFVPFTVEFSQLLPDEYISKFIIGKFRPAIIVIGYDHRFGRNRSGDINFLKSYARSGGYKVVEIEPQSAQGIQISSTKIRNQILAGDIKTANALLGHPYLISGKVVRGHNFGEKLGFPTANIHVGNPLKLLPPLGIYAVEALWQGRVYPGMLYIGKRPTVTDTGRISVEVHIFNFREDIYGQLLFVKIIEFIRPDAVFNSIEALRERIELDKEATLKIFESQINETDNSASVVILNHNGRHHLSRFLPSVIRNTSGNADIIVADNGSTDGSLAYLQDHFPEVKTIDLGKNYGFAAGYNLVIQQINSKYIFLVNSDVEVTSNWMFPLLNMLKTHKNIAACQPKIRSFQNKNLFEYAGAAGGLMDWFGYPFCQGRILSVVEEDMGQYDQNTEVFWVSGAAMAIKRKPFLELGGFDEDFFAHMEEIDLCWRLKKTGYRVFMVPDSLVYHLGGGTLSYQSPMKTYLNFRNGITILIKNEKLSRLIWLLPLRLTLDVVAMIRFLILGERSNVKAVMNSLFYVFRFLPKTIRKRRKMVIQIKKGKVGQENSETGRYFGSIIWEFFILGKKRFADFKKVSSGYSP